MSLRQLRFWKACDLLLLEQLQLLRQLLGWPGRDAKKRGEMWILRMDLWLIYVDITNLWNFIWDLGYVLIWVYMRSYGLIRNILILYDIIIDKLWIISYQIHYLQEYINYIINSLIIWYYIYNHIISLGLCYGKEFPPDTKVSSTPAHGIFQVEGGGRCQLRMLVAESLARAELELVADSMQLKSAQTH